MHAMLLTLAALKAYEGIRALSILFVAPFALRLRAFILPPSSLTIYAWQLAAVVVGP